jgi:hypothetical protein
MGKRRVDEDGLTRQQRRHQLAAQGWACTGWDRETTTWRFQGPDGRQRLVPSQTEGGAMRALLRHLHGETDAAACTE